MTRTIRGAESRGGAAPTVSIANANFGKTIGALAGTSGRQMQLSGRFTF